MNSPSSRPLATIKAVLWSFIGVRKRQDYESDAQQLKPFQVIVAGLISGALFVLSLVFIVWLVMRYN